jgi:hypothetical protein
MPGAQTQGSVLACLPALVGLLRCKTPVEHPIQTPNLSIIPCVSSRATVVERCGFRFVLLAEGLPSGIGGVREEVYEADNGDACKDGVGVCTRCLCDLYLPLVRHPAILHRPIVSHFINHPICNLSHDVVPALPILPLSFVW